MSRTGFGEAFDAGSQCFADPGGITISPSGFNQGPPRASIAVKPLRFTVSPVELSAGTSPRNDISFRGVSNRRTSPISAAKVTATKNEAPRICLIRRNHRRHGPTGHDDSQLLFQAMQSLPSVLDRVDAFLED